MKKILFISVLSLSILGANAQDATVSIQANQGENKIHKEIYGQFAEHLGSCIYEYSYGGRTTKTVQA